MIFLQLGGAAIFIGLIASMIGVGGGIFMVPLLSLSRLVPTTQEAVGTSLAAVVFTSISSTLAYRTKGVLALKLGLMLMPGIIVGAQLGPRLSVRMPKARLRQLFGLVLLYSSVNMVLNGIKAS